MQDKNLYEYAVIRAVPRPEREEFLNIGVVLFCKRAKYLKVLYKIDTAKLQPFCGDFDSHDLGEYLQAIDKICNGSSDGGLIASFDIPSRFRWLTAVRSSIVQTSRPHPGLSNNLDETLHKLFKELVL